MSWSSIVLFVAVYGIFLTQCECQSEYKVLTGKMSWHDADRDCRSRDGSLLVLEGQGQVKRFHDDVKLEPRTTVWTAAYRQQSPWVWIEGCFSAKRLSSASGVLITGNQASECASMCAKSTYAALKGSMCYCLRDMRNLSPLDARVCDLPCPGSPHEKCGGQGAVSLYSLGGVTGYKESVGDVDGMPEQTVHVESRSDWKNCVYILKHDTAVWVTTDCRKPLPFLCKIYKDEGIVTEYKSPKNKQGSWTQARDMCRAEGGTLADLHANNKEAVSALPEMSEFWVGLYRNTTWTWHTKNEEETPMWCTSLTVDALGEHHLQTESCSIPHEYVCQIDIPAKAVKSASNMVIYVVCGTIAWVLAIVTGVLVFFMVRKRHCVRNRVEGETTEIHRNYFDLEEEPGVSRPTPHHSYVNTPSENQPSCTGAATCETSCSNPKSAKASGGKGSSTPQKVACANVYASVKMANSKREPAEQYDDLVTQVMCASAFGAPSPRSSTSTEGDYDLVWDSVKFTAKDGSNRPRSENRNSQLSENIYTEIDKVFRVDVSGQDSLDLKSPSALFPPSDEFGKKTLERKASNTL